MWQSHKVKEWIQSVIASEAWQSYTVVIASEAWQSHKNYLKVFL